MSDSAKQTESRRRLLDDHAAVPQGALRRLWRAGKSALELTATLRKVGAGRDWDEAALQQAIGQLGELRGLAMKAGQMLGYLDASLPESVRASLSVLQTAAPTTPYETVAATIEAALGARAPQLLARLEPVPIAAASIGQVHRGVLPDGTAVAVKVRHPGIAEAIAADFRSASVGSVMGTLIGGAGIPAMIDEARQTFAEECDFALEARRQTRFAEIFAGDPDVVIPAVEAAWSTPDVLVTRFCDGTGLDAWLAGGPSQAARDRVGVALFRFWMQTLYAHGLFHGDPHPGNFAVDDTGRVIVYDFGCVREIPEALRLGLGTLAAATRQDDLDAMARAITQLGGEAPRALETRLQLRRLLRGFFGPLLTSGPRAMSFDEGAESKSVLADKRTILALRLPPRMLFLFRLRFGLFSVLAKLGAVADWAALESRWASTL